MCGIALLNLSRPQPGAGAVLERMLECQRHRGPDHTGIWRSADQRTLMGHNRLSILDLSSAGNQPFASADGRLHVVVNGEIYNYRELRARLEAQGHRFASRSDSEVVLHLYEDRGTELVEDLQGMFVFALHDSERDLVFCARDRLGKKPLVYGETATGLVVASEIPAALQMPGVDRAIDATALGLYFLRNFRHVPDPLTIHRGLRRLPPGHALVASGGRVDRVWKYWQPSFASREVRPAEVLEVFDRAVERRLMADVEIGALLSGGVDSTAVVQAMTTRVGAVRTYALGRNAEDEELVRARRAARLLGSDHQEFYFDPDRHHDLSVQLIRLHGEPIALLPLAFAYDLCTRIRQDGLKVVMSGHGADEIFYGYTGFGGLAAVSRALRFWPRGLRPLAGALSTRIPSIRAREGLLVAGASSGGRKAALYAEEARRLLPELLVYDRAAVAEVEASVSDIFATWVAPGAPEPYVDEAAVLGLMVENTHSVTTAGDLPGMAAGVEMRSPFLDQELVELAWRTPFRSKVGDGGRLKAILKDALAERLPTDLLNAPKQGFGTNLQEVDVLAGPWKGHVQAGVASLGDLDGLLDVRGVAALLERFFASPGGDDARLVSKLYALSVAAGSW